LLLRCGMMPIDETPLPAALGLRVLLIDDGAHHTTLLRDELTRQGCDVVGVLDSATLVHDCVLRLAPDVVIVDSESPTRDTLEQLATLSSRHPRPVVVFAEDDADDPMRAALQAGVSAYVVAGLRPERLASVLKVAIARYEQDTALRAQLGSAQAELAQRKVIERAKGLLMKSAGLDEGAAYERLRRHAMDRGLKLHEVAAQVLAAHELLQG
jgi:response regulator NasT